MSELPFRYRLRVRFGECDAQKVVFNARYGDYVDLAVLEFLRALGLKDRLIHGDLDYQLVKQTTEWRAPAHFDEVLEARVQVLGLGTTSFTVEVAFHRAEASAACARSETVYVMQRAGALGKTPIPPEVRALLAQGAPGRVTDHSGG